MRWLLRDLGRRLLRARRAQYWLRRLLHCELRWQRHLDLNIHLSDAVREHGAFRLLEDRLDRDRF